MSKYNLTRIKGLLMRVGIEFETVGNKIMAYKFGQESCTIFLTSSGEINFNDKTVTDQEFENWICEGGRYEIRNIF